MTMSNQTFLISVGATLAAMVAGAAAAIAVAFQPVGMDMAWLMLALLLGMVISMFLGGVARS